MIGIKSKNCLRKLQIELTKEANLHSTSTCQEYTKENNSPTNVSSSTKNHNITNDQPLQWMVRNATSPIRELSNYMSSL